MKTGDIVTDSRARAWTLGPLLGEGVWGRTWQVRDDDGRQRVLKAPYEAHELPPASAERAALMRACSEEQADRLVGDASTLLALEDRITLPSGAVALLFPYMPTTLHRQLQSGLPLSEALTELLGVVDLLEKARTPHGNLRPTNILIDPHGAPILADVATPSTSALLAAAERATPGRRRWVPPDHVAPDTWAICQALYAAVMLDEPSDRSRADVTLPAAPMEGLDKVARASLKDHAIARLKRDGANTRFVARTADRLVALLARGLSKETDPSPPYRFLRAADLRPRLAEVIALIHPSVESVGKLLLASNATGDVFSGPGPVGFTVSVAASEGIHEADDLVCGVRLTNLDAQGDGRVPLDNAQFAVNKHPSGRLRFEFNLPDVAPGRYGVRVAFTIKDSGHEPVVAEGSFEVRPPPGYVPPLRQDGPATLSFPGRPAERTNREDAPAALRPFAQAFVEPDSEEDEDDPTVLMPKTFDTDSDPGGELIDAFPRPLAPSLPGAGFRSSFDDEDDAIGSPVAGRPNPYGRAPQGAPASQGRPPLAAPRPLLAPVPTPAPTDPGQPGTDASSVDLEPWESAPPPMAEAPSVVQARPSIAMVQPQLSPSVQPWPAPQASPAAAAPRPTPAPGPPRPTPAPGPPRPTPAPGPPRPMPAPAPLPTEDPWQTSQVEESDFFNPDAALPGRAGDDLIPEVPRPPSPFDAARKRFTELVQRDSPTAIGAAIGGCFLLLVFAMALARAC